MTVLSDYKVLFSFKVLSWVMRLAIISSICKMLHNSVHSEDSYCLILLLGKKNSILVIPEESKRSLLTQNRPIYFPDYP